MVYYQNKGFTLIEISIVILIVVILLISFIYIWSGLEVIQKARDVKRINDLNLLNSVILSILSNQSIYLGEENIIYLSLPDSTSTCASYNLVAVYSPYRYQCQSNDKFLKIDGQGWLPLNLTSSEIIGLTVLPIDPLNNENYFYAYQTKNSKIKLTANLESKAFALKMITDGGVDPLLYEVGSDVTIPSPHSGLVAFWNFNESGYNIYDSSGYQRNGRTYSSTTLLDLHSTSSCQIGFCLKLDGLDDYFSVEISQNYLLTKEKPFTVFLIAKPEDLSGRKQILQRALNSSDRIFIALESSKVIFGIYDGSFWKKVESSNSLETNKFYFITAVYKGDMDLEIYLNEFRSTTNSTLGYGYPWPNLEIGKYSFYSQDWFKGIIDDILIYNRSLSKKEVEILLKNYNL